MSFVLLASSSRTGQLRVEGAVARSFRGAYDILVRPRGSFTRLERHESLVRDNYLSGIFGGITMRAYHVVEHLQGVAVAAPIANLGYMLVDTQIPISIHPFVTGAPTQLYRLRLGWLADDGTSRYPGGDLYVYFTRRHRFSTTGGVITEPTQGARLPVCRGFVASEPSFYGPFDPAERTGLACYSARSPAAARLNYANYGQIRFRFPRRVGAVADAYVPIFVTAIDPRAEARLAGVNRTVVSGRYLRETDRARVRFRDGLGARVVPVITSSVAYARESLHVSVQRLATPRSADVAAVLASDGCDRHPTKDHCPDFPHRSPSPSRVDAYSFLTHLRGRTVGRLAIPVAAAYQRALAHASSITGDYWTTSQVGYRAVSTTRLVPRVVRNDPISTWTLPAWGEINGGYYEAPADNQDVQFRRVTEHVASNAYAGSIAAAPRLDVVGRYDPRRLRGFSSLSRLPMETYYPPLLEPATTATRQALHGRSLEPSQNLGGYIEQSPLMLTTLAGIKPFLDRHAYSNLTPRQVRAPISVIRVRVAGVTGDDALSRARIRLVAEEIHNQTGLAVDITAGSSPTPVTIELPAGRYGRPPLVLDEGWTKKGVAVAYLNAVDRASLLLFGLILVVCALFLANGALAATKARRGEFATLLTFGWAPRHVFWLLIVELAVIGATAGALGAIVALLLISIFHIHLSLVLAVGVLPVATALSIVSGLLPAWAAAHGQPVDVLRPPVTTTTHGRHVRGLTGLALANLVRVPLRTLIGCTGLAIGVAGTAVLIGIQQAFHGQLVSSVLGNAIAVQVRGVDQLSVALTIVLAACSVTDLIYLNMRERHGELATLTALGWTNGHLRRLIGLETLGLGIMGSLAGATAALIAGWLLGLPAQPLVVGCALAALAGIVVSQLAALVPLIRIGRPATAEILAEDA